MTPNQTLPAGVHHIRDVLLEMEWPVATITETTEKPITPSNEIGEHHSTDETAWPERGD